MAVYRRTSRGRYVLALLLLASVTLVTLDAKGAGLSRIRGEARSVLDPVSNATHDALAPIGNFLTGAADYGSLKKENDRLRAQIAGMQANGSATQSAEAEAAQVLGQAHLTFASNLKSIPAAVIGQAPDNFDTSVEIDKGTSSGVALNDPVVTQAGLVGTVVEVTSHRATIRTLTDPQFSVGVSLPGTTGVATGAGPGNPLQVAKVDPATPVTRGMILTTSGLSLETFPRGIPVGRVTSVYSTVGALQATVALAPLISTSQLLVVSVLVYSGQTP